METEFRRAILPADLRSLMTFDRACFSRGDWFPADYWRAIDSYWMLIEGRKVGCCAFEPHRDFDDHSGERPPRRAGSLYIATTGIRPAQQGKGYGSLLKAWEVAYARRHDFERVVTNVRKRNHSMIALNEKFGFRAIKTIPRYYAAPADATVVMELVL